jgi:hypothetical protein
MMWHKKALAILDQFNGMDIRKHDLDNISYYMVHSSSPEMWSRILDLGEGMVYYSRTMQKNYTNEGEQLWLPFDQH